MTARSVCPLLRTELGTWCLGPSDTRHGFSRTVMTRTQAAVKMTGTLGAPLLSP